MVNIARLKYEKDKKALMDGAASSICAASEIEQTYRIKLLEDTDDIFKQFIEMVNQKKLKVYPQTFCIDFRLCLKKKSSIRNN
jgi:hypothetical protein